MSARWAARTRRAPRSRPRYPDGVQILLIRHAEAVDETLALRDPHRHLTERGRDQARALGERLREGGHTATQIWASPLVRALQTAELVAQGLASLIGVEVVPALAPEGSQHDVAAAVRALAPDSCVLLVGHEPAISAIGCLLVGDADFGVIGKAQAVVLVDGRVTARIDGS